MVVLVTSKSKEDPIKNEGATVLTTFLPLLVYEIFFRRSRATNTAVRGRLEPNVELIRDFIVVLLTCKNEEETIKKEGARVLTIFSPLNPYGSYLLPWQPF